MKTAGGYPVRMRAGAIAVVALVAAALGAASVLVIGSAAGWVGDRGVETVVVPTVESRRVKALPARRRR